MVNKKIVVICSIIAIIIVGTIVGINIKKCRKNYFKDIEKTNSLENDINNNTNTTIENETNKTSTENVVDESSNIIRGEEEQNTTSSEGDKSEEAISLAKKEWGETDETVYYTIDNVSGNIYTISVRSKSSTAQLAEYEVDISNKKVTIQ